MKNLLTTIISALLLLPGFSAFAQTNALTSSAVPLRNSKSDNHETIGNTVNLATGEVGFPVNLVSLDGRNGLSASLSLTYSSAGISKKISTWNLDAPTGVAGLGWSLDFPRIVVDNQQTGTREDDIFYIYDGGENIPLQRISDNTNFPNWQMYATTGSQRWIVKYQPSTERWEVTVESGTTYVYGDANSGRSTVQWIVKWGNWIGNSTKAVDDRLTPIQQQQAVIWNLSEITNIWQDKILYEYLNVNQQVGIGGKEQTEASYLRKITDVFGRTITLNYENKSANEYQEPHTEQSEPDAYQEVYEKLFLSSVEVKNEAGKVLSTIRLGYSSIGAGSLTKRLLISVKKMDESDEPVPTTYTYIQSGNNKGKLETSTSPNGKRIKYIYNSGQKVGHLNTDLVINSPGTGFTEPEVVMNKNYVLVSWRQLKLQNGQASDDYQHALGRSTVWAKLYTWEGEWIEQDLGLFYGVDLNSSIYTTDFKFSNDANIDDRNFSRQYFYTTFQDDFFAIMSPTTSDFNPWANPTPNVPYKLSLFSRDKNKRGVWVRQDQTGPFGSILDKPSMVSGNNFVSVVAKKSGPFSNLLSIYSLTGNNWSHRLIGGGQGPTQGYVTAANNYLMVHDEASSKITFYHISPKGEVNSTVLPSAISIGGSNSYWYSSNSYSFVMAGGYNEFIYGWDENYSNFKRYDVLGAYTDASAVYLDNSMVGITESRRGRAARYDGYSWLVNNETSTRYNYGTAYAEDLILWDAASSSTASYTTFNPNTRSWRSPASLGSYSGFSGLHARNNYFWHYNNFYYRNPTGIWELKRNISVTGAILWGAFGTGYTNTGAYNNGSSLYTFNVKNGDIRDLYFSNQTNSKIESGYQTTAVFNTKTRLNATRLTLTRVLEEREGGSRNEVLSCPVAGIEASDGMNTTYTSFKYDFQTATTDPTATVASFNKITTVPGVQPTTDNSYSGNPFGYTEQYFFNGLPAEATALAYDQTGLASGSYVPLNGNLYETRIYNNANVLVGSAKTVWTVKSESLYSELAAVALKYCTLPLHSESTKDGVTTTTDNTYNDKNLLSGTTTYNSNFKGIQDQVQTRVRYASEIYSNMAGLNILTVPALTQKSVNGTVTEVQVTTYKDWGNNVWAPFKIYTWQGNGSSDFDFAAYSGSQEPSESGWKRINYVISRDGKGNILSSKNVSGITTSAVFGHKKSLPVMQAINAQYDEILTEDFDDENLDDNDPFPVYRTAGWLIKEGILKSSSAGSTALMALDKELSNTDFIADFSLRIVPDNSNQNWAGFQFNKTQPGDSYTSPGSALVLHPNGTIEVLNAGQAVASAAISDAGGWHMFKVIRQAGMVSVYVDGILKLSGISVTATGKYFGLATNNCLSEFDNLRIYSTSSKAVSTAYEKDYHSIKSTTDNYGLITRKLLDKAGRTVATIDVKGVPVETVNSSFSSLRNNNSFNANDPNLILNTSVRGKDGFYEDFETSGKVWTEINRGRGSTWQVENGHLLLDTYMGMIGEDKVNSFLIDFSKEYTGRVGVEMDVTSFNESAGMNFGIALGGDAWDGSNGGTELSVLTAFDSYNWNVYANNAWSRIGNNSFKRSNKYRLKIIADVNSQKADLYIDGKLLKYDVPFVMPSTGIRKLSLIDYGIGEEVRWWIDNITVYTDPVHLLTLTDADGDVVQKQTEEPDNQIMVSEILKDAAGRPYIQTRPTRIAARFGFRPDFITGVSTAGVMSGEVVTVNPDDGGYPYTQNAYELSPLGRVTEQSKPGAEFKTGSGHTVTTEYTNNSLFYVGSYPEYSYYVKKMKDEDGNLNITVTDKEEKLVKKEQGKILVQEYVSPLPPPCKGCASVGRTYNRFESVSTYEYDIYGNLVQYNSPNYNRDYVQDTPESIQLDQANTTGIYSASKSITLLPGFSSGSTFSASINSFSNYADKMVYDFEGKLIQKTTPDNGTTKFLYDKEGRVRFRQDAVAAKNNQVVYSVYNLFGQITEEGYLVNQSWDTNVLGNYLSASPYSPDGYPSGRIWKKKLSYGTFGNTLFDYDKPVKTEINNNQDAVPEVEAYFTYDIDGNMIRKGTKASSYSSSVYNIDYAYNNAGQKTQVNYNISGFDPVLIDYDISGRTSSVRSGSISYAVYSYNKNGNLGTEKLNNANLVRTYAYNTQGKVSQIDDPYFREDLGYTGIYRGLISSIDNTYKAGAGWTSLPSAYSVSYAYDEQGRLIKADNSINSYDLGAGAPVTYDANGNITFQNQNNISRNYKYLDGTNRLSHIENITSQLKYDENGNVISSLSEGATISYDVYFNQTSAIATANSTTAFQYGAENERVLKQNSYNGQTHTTCYIRGTEDYPLIEESPQGRKIYIYGPNGLIAIKQDGQLQYALKDHLGSTRVLVSESGTVVAHFDYLAFGSLMRSTNPSQINYKYTGQEYDDETGLQNSRARMYDSDLGIFYGTDPDDQYYSPYVYCGNNPVQLVDPSGRSSIWASLLQTAVNLGVNLANQAVNGGIKNFQVNFSTTFNLNGVSGIFSRKATLASTVSSVSLYDEDEMESSNINGADDEKDKPGSSDNGGGRNNPFLAGTSWSTWDDAPGQDQMRSIIFEGVRVSWGYNLSGTEAWTTPLTGITVSRDIFRRRDDINIPNSLVRQLILHEFGHILQAKYGGNFWYALAVIPSSIVSASGDHHMRNWTEIQANTLAWLYFRQDRGYWWTAKYPIDLRTVSPEMIKTLNNRK